MAIIPFTEWVPDSADLGNPGSITIKNAIPGLNSYKPMPSLEQVTSAIDARPRGAIEAVDFSANVFQYVGDAAKLYQRNGSSWTDVSIGGGYSTTTLENWEFVRWKNKVLATNFDDNPQQITFGASNFSNLTTAFRARHIAIVRDFVVFGSTFDGTDGARRSRVRWSAFDDETDYTVSPVTLSDFQDLSAGGAVQRIVGGEYGVVVSERSTFRMTFAGAPAVFQIDEVLPGVGTIAPGSVINLGDTTYFISEQGFVAITSGSQESYPGAGRVDKFIREDLDETYVHRVSSVADPRSGLIFWAYPGAGNNAGTPNKIICYDTRLDKWSLIEQESELIWRSGGVATTLDDLDDFMLGTTLVSNGDFASGTGWTTGAGWAIGSGTATKTAGTGSDLSQSVSPTEDDYYRVIFDVSGRTAGSVTPALGGTSGIAVSANGTDNRQTIRAGSGSDVTFTADASFDGSIDNVSVQRITTIDELGISLDDPQWKGGSVQLSGFFNDFTNGNFSGSPMTAIFETREVELNANRKTVVNEFKPVIDCGSVSAEVGTRMRQTDSVAFNGPFALRDTGVFKCREKGQYHRFRLTASGDWCDAIGVQVDNFGARVVGRRG